MKVERGHMSRLLKVLNVMLIITAIGISLSYAETIWEKRQKASQGIEEKLESAEVTPAAPTSTSPIPLNEIYIPEYLGSVIETHEGTNGKLIVHIQDAHANYEAQKNIAGIIETLMADHGVKLILREGGISDKDFTYLRNEASLDARIRASEGLLKDTTITAIDYVNITTDYPMTIQGMEEKGLYDENRFSILELDKFRGVASEYVQKMSSAADNLKQKIYNQGLLALDKAKKDYESEASDLLAYYSALNEIAQKKGVPTSEYRNFTALMKINDMEKKIDFAKVNSDEATEDEKKLYSEYQNSLKELNVNRLFKEEPLLENKIQKGLSENSDQKELYSISKALSIIDKMLNVKLVPEEYTYFLENKRDFDPKLWTDFLRKKSDELGMGLQISENHYAVTDNMPTIEKVYETALKRDKVFVQKTAERLKKDNEDKAILVAGGFHTPTLTQLLNDAGYSYIVISPKVSTKTDDNVYKESLKGEWAEPE